jgi:H+/Cl- antiporter ClcA
VENFVLWKWSITEKIIDNKPMGLAMLTFLALSVLFGGVAALLTVFVGPGAIGSGTTELMGYLNGVNYPNYIGLRTLFVKVLGTSLAVAAGLCIGKEGPLAHIGAIVGHAVLYLPFDFLKKFQNETTKREAACAGAAAGVSAAFGAPIGGTLFIYEVSRPSTFWSFQLTWMVFFSSSISTFVLGLLCNLVRGDSSITNTGLIKFGHYSSEAYSSSDLPFFIILGMTGGLLGSFFNFVNGEINAMRGKFLNTPWKKVLETISLTGMTALIIFYAPLITASNCEKETDKLETEFIKYTCPDGDFNPLATLLLNPEGTTIKAFLNPGAIFDYSTLLMHFMIWYGMTIITYGTCIPAGLFLPGILIGCSLGRIMTLFINVYLGWNVLPATYAIIGAASVLAGYTRLSFSLAVIMLETTENVNMFLPIVMTLFVSFAVGRLFNRSLYSSSIGMKAIPFLVETVPKYNEHLRAENIVSSPCRSLQKRVSVQTIGESLRDTTFNGFPVIGEEDRPIGLISRHVLLHLLVNLDRVDDCADKANLLNKQEDHGLIKQHLIKPNKRDIEELDDHEIQTKSL